MQKQKKKIMEITRKELNKMANKLRAGEAIEIDGHRLKAKKVDVQSQYACAYCDLKYNCYATLCSLLDVYNPETRKLTEAYYLEYES